MLSRFKQIEMYLLRQGHFIFARRCPAYRLLTGRQSYSGSTAKPGSEEEWNCSQTHPGVIAGERALTVTPLSTVDVKNSYIKQIYAHYILSISECNVIIKQYSLDYTFWVTINKVYLKETHWPTMEERSFANNVYNLTLPSANILHTCTRFIKFTHHWSNYIMKCDISSKGANGVWSH